MRTPAATILRTIVTPGGAEDRVQLEISDEPPQVEKESMDGSIRMNVEVKIDAYRTPPIEYVQLKAVETTINALTEIQLYLQQVMKDNGYNSTPPLKTHAK